MSKSIIADTLINYNKSAVLSLHAGENEKALEYFRESFRIEKELKFEQQSAQTLMNISNTEILLKNYAEALQHALEAKEIFEKLSCKKDNFTASLLVGNIYYITKKYADSLSVFQDIVRKCDINDIKGEAYFALYHTSVELGDVKNLLDYLNKAVDNFKRSQNIIRYKAVLTERIKYFEKTKKNSLAAMDLYTFQSLDK